VTDYAAVLGRLELVAGGPPWSARCPNKPRHKHGDRSPSLRLWLADDGKLMAKCYAGCSFVEINDAIGTRPSEWFPPKEEARPVRKALHQYDAVYDYRDERGELLFQVCRKNLAGGGKTFSQRRPVPGFPGEWAYSLHAGYYRGEHGGSWSYSAKDRPHAVHLPDVRVVLYRLPDLAANPDSPAIVVEGEKDVETLAKVFLGYPVCVTTSPMGAKNWKHEFGAWLSHRRIAVIPDHAEEGYAYAYRVAASALAYGAHAVRVVAWPEDTAIGADVSDWLLEHHAQASAEQKRAAVLGLIRGAKAWRPE
jgi:putative DNA primase/helicase